MVLPQHQATGTGCDWSGKRGVASTVHELQGDSVGLDLHPVRVDPTFRPWIQLPISALVVSAMPVKTSAPRPWLESP